MTRVKLAHNPFTVKTQIWIDGDELPCDHPLTERCSRRLQMWVDVFFSELYEEDQSKHFELEFCGLETDYQDIASAAQKAENNLGITVQCKHIPTKDVNERIEQLKALSTEAQASDIDQLRSDDFNDQFEKALAPDFTVNVIATMSAGKSTVINGMLGRDLLPVKNEACTATIARITDKDGAEDFEGRRISESGAVLDDWQAVDSETLEKWNEDENTFEIHVCGDISGVREQDHARLVLVDTPGPNNSRNSEHRMATKRIIQDTNMPLVLYVLNATNLSTDDDKGLLLMVREAISAQSRQARDRFIFAVNKIDEFDPEKGESPEGALKNVQDYLKDNGIEGAYVYPISALLTKLIRIKQKGQNELTRKERGDMATMQEIFLEEKEMHLLQYMPVSSGVRQHAEERIQQYAQDGDDDNLAMMHSGLPVIEMVIEEYVRKYALPFRICQAKEVLETFIEMAEINSEGIKELEQDKGNLEKTRKELKGLRESVEQGEFARSFEEKINCKKVGLSPEAKKQRKELEKKFEDKKKSVQNDLKDSKVTESEGKRAITVALRDAEQLLENIVLGMETMIEDAWVAEKNILDGEYAECVAVFLDQSRFKFPAAKSWGKTVAKLPSTNIWREKFETSIWLTLPFIVLTSGPLYSAVRAFFEKKYTKDDLNEAWKSIEVEISDKFSKNLKAAETNLLDQTKQVRKEYITFVNKNLDMKMKELLRVREDALVSEKKLEEKVHEAEKKLAWLKSFRGKLDAVLSL